MQSDDWQLNLLLGAADDEATVSSPDRRSMCQEDEGALFVRADADEHHPGLGSGDDMPHAANGIIVDNVHPRQQPWTPESLATSSGVEEPAHQAGAAQTTSQSSELEQWRLDRRRERNRRAAQRSRQRKLSYIRDLEDKILQLKQENMRLMRLLHTGAHPPTQSIDTGGRVGNVFGGGNADDLINAGDFNHDDDNGLSRGDGMVMDPLVFGGGDNATDAQLQATEPTTAASAYQLRSRHGGQHQ